MGIPLILLTHAPLGQCRSARGTRCRRPQLVCGGVRVHQGLRGARGQGGSCDSASPEAAQRALLAADGRGQPCDDCVPERSQGWRHGPDGLAEGVCRRGRHF
eukprot:Amastigsp_a508445_28.p3 type:complete len:102 gc:universal Amastigsp_a508445_28:1-306(+)